MTPKLKRILELAKGSEPNLLQEAGINADDVWTDNSELTCEPIQVDPSLASVTSVDAAKVIKSIQCSPDVSSALRVSVAQDVLIPSVSALMMSDIYVFTSTILDAVTHEMSPVARHEMMVF